MKKHRFAAVLAAVLFSSSSCGFMVVNDLSGQDVLDYNNNIAAGGKDTETDPPETVTPYTPYEEENFDSQIEKYLSALPEKDFGGTTFFITSPLLNYIEPDQDHMDEPVSQQIYERNRMLEGRYNISISTSLVDANTMLTEVQNAISSELYYTDLMMVPLYMTGYYQNAGVLENLRSLPYLNMSNDYFYEESVNALSAGHTTWGIAGYGSVAPLDISCVYINTDLAKQAGMEAPYHLVEEGKWTWDQFFAYVEAVKTLNMQSDRPHFTVTAQNTASRLADLVFTSCGNRFVLSGEMLIPTLSFTEDSAGAALGYASQIFMDDRSVTDSTAGAVDCFFKGDSLFLIDYVYVTEWLADASVNWGILPIPKQNFSDKHRTLVSNTTLVYTVPAKTFNTEMASVMLSAMNAASYHVLHDAYVEHQMIYSLRDNASVNMLDTVLDTVTFDFALAFGSAYPNIADGTYKLVRNTAAAGSRPANFADMLSKANTDMAQRFPLQ